MDIRPRKKRPLSIDIKKPQPNAPKEIKQHVINQQKSFKADMAKISPKKFTSPLALKSQFTDTDKVKQLISGKSEEATTFLKENIVALIFLVLTTFLAIFFYIYRIKTLPQPSLLDSPEFLNAASLNEIIKNTSFLPQKILDYVLLKIQLDGPTAFKLVSVVLSVSTFVLFFLIIQRWISFRIAALTTFLFASSTLALAATRSSSYENLLFFAPIILLLTGSVIKSSPRSLWVLPMLFLVTLTIYIPGFIWALLLCLILFIKPMARFFLIQSVKSKIAGVLTILIVLTPLIAGTIKNPKSILSIAGVPNDFTLNTSDVLSRLYEFPRMLIVNGPDNPAFWLSGTPILDAATATFVATGVYYLFKNKSHPIRRRVLLLLTVLICLLCVLLSSVFIFMLVPLVYIFAALGLTFLLEQWFHIFPRNPFAKSVGYSLMCILIITIASYHVSRYFVAWPRNESTKQAFQEMSSDTIDKNVSAIFKETQ